VRAPGNLLAPAAAALSPHSLSSLSSLPASLSRATPKPDGRATRCPRALVAEPRHRASPALLARAIRRRERTKPREPRRPLRTLPRARKHYAAPTEAEPSQRPTPYYCLRAVTSSCYGAFNPSVSPPPFLTPLMPRRNCNAIDGHEGQPAPIEALSGSDPSSSLPLSIKGSRDPLLSPAYPSSFHLSSSPVHCSTLPFVAVRRRSPWSSPECAVRRRSSPEPRIRRP
jgi:hypothetical protein